MGVNYDVQYISDSLRGSKNGPPKRFAMWSRVRGTVDIDFGRLLDWNGWY
jgi:hypothetical protein